MCIESLRLFRRLLPRFAPAFAVFMGVLALVGFALPSSALPAVGVAAAEESPDAMRGETVRLASVEELRAAGWSHFEVERNGWSQKVRYRDLDTDELQVMKFKGIPWSRGSATNIVVPDRIYDSSTKWTSSTTTTPGSTRACAAYS